LHDVSEHDGGGLLDGWPEQDQNQVGPDLAASWLYLAKRDHASPLSGRQPKAVQTGLQVLEEVARRGTGVTAEEVAHSLHLPPATAYRVLNILVAEGYLVRTPDLHGFALGRKLSGLVTAAAPPTVCHAARQVLAELRGRVRFGVHLVLYTASAAKVVDPDPDHPYIAAQLLTRYRHASAVGKLLLPNCRTGVKHA
jgi:DNA-binding IclR family transcriptional regulator